MKLFLSIASNEGFDLTSVDIRAAFLQSREMDREVFIEPPRDIKKEGSIWRLKKPLYGLNDASRKFWLRVREIFKALGFKVVKGDEAFYYKHENGRLIGMIVTHVDDFIVAGSPSTIDSVKEAIMKELTISKVESNSFRFTGLDICKHEEGITVSMKEYADSIEDLEDIRNAPNEDKLTNQELKVYRKYTGKLSWLAANTRPDLAIVSLMINKKMNSTTIKDFK